MLDNYEINQLNNLKFSNPDLFVLFQKMENDFLTLTSKACHDIRNNIALVDNYSQLISERSPNINDNPMWKKLIKNTSLSVKKLDDIAAFRYSYKMNDMIKIMLNDICLELKKTYPDICINSETDVDTFYGIYDNIVYSLSALITNSFEAYTDSKDNPVLVNISDNDNLLHFDITDNGQGFSEEPDNPFTPFYSTKKEHTGLGLSTAYNTAVRHGGFLSIKNPANPTVVDFSVRLNG